MFRSSLENHVDMGKLYVQLSISLWKLHAINGLDEEKGNIRDIITETNRTSLTIPPELGISGR